MRLSDLVSKITGRNMAGEGFVKNIFAMMSGTTLSMLLLVAATPVLTRLYSPRCFGVLGFYMAVVGIVTVFAAGRYDFALVTTEKDQEAGELLGLALICSLVTTLVMVLAGFFWMPLMTRLSGVDSLESWFFLLTGGVFTTAIYQAFNYYLIRLKQFRYSAASNVARTLVTIAAQVLLALLWKAETLSLLGGYFLGQFAAALVVMLGVFKNDKEILVNTTASVGSLLNVAGKYKKYPLLNSFSSSLNSLTTSLPVIFLTRYFGTAVSGYYTLAARLLQLPSYLIGRAFSQVLYQRLAEEENLRGNPKRLMEKSFAVLFGLSLGYLVLMLLTPLYLVPIFGQGWQRTVFYILILAPSFSLIFIVSPLSVVAAVKDRIELVSIWQVCAFAVILFWLLLSGPWGNDVLLLTGLSAANILLYLVYLKMILSTCSTGIKEVSRETLSMFIRLAGRIRS